MAGLGGIERAGQPGLDVAEGASPRAGVAHDHEGGVLFLPALADIGTAGLLAHRVRAVGAHDAGRLDIAGRDRRLDADPVGLAQAWLIRPVRLFRVANRAGLAEQSIDNNGHNGSGAYCCASDTYEPDCCAARRCFTAALRPARE